MHDNYDLRQEQMNKSSLLSSRKFLSTLLDIFTTHVVSTIVVLLFCPENIVKFAGYTHPE